MTSMLKSNESDDLALNLTHVDKVYSPGLLGRGKGRVHALCGISMQVHRGAVFGLLGPNGAGKSTLVKILMTVIRATQCHGTMLGYRVGDKAGLRHVGYLPEHHRFPEYLTAAQVLDYFGALSEVPRMVRRQRGGELLDLVGLGKWGKTRVRSFSKGMRQRLGVANALINDPDLVVLDEPTDGVDPVGRRDIREFLLGLRDRGKTVFLNSHLLSELEMVCDRVAILVQGRVSSQGTIEELTRDSRRYEVELLTPDGKPASAEAARSLVGAALPREQLVTLSEGMIRVPSDDPLVVQPVIDAARAKGWTIRAVRPVRSSLEDLFMAAVTDPTSGNVLVPGAQGGPGAREAN